MANGHHGLRGLVALLLAEAALTSERVHVPILLLNTMDMIALSMDHLTQGSKAAIPEHAVIILARKLLLFDTDYSNILYVTK